MRRIPALALLATAAALAERLEFTEMHMGVPVRIVLHAPSEAQGRAAARAAFDRVRAWDDALTDWRADSPAMRLPQRAGDAAIVDGRLRLALEAAHRLGTATGGAFDASLGRLTALWRQARRTGTPPAAGALDEARAASGPDAWSWESESARFTARRDGVRMDFGAIGQGLAADDALAALREAGFPSALVDASGDIAVGAPPPGQEGWRIVVEPEFDGQPAEALLLRDCGVSTSGDRAQRAQVAGAMVSHLVDPRTGAPLPAPRQATVVARDATTADALATALCVLEARDAAAVASTFGVSARLDRIDVEGGVQPLGDWRGLRRASSCPEAGSSAPEGPRPSPASEASGPPCSPTRPSR